jgi:Essential protein Yae1, N terminal
MDRDPTTQETLAPELETTSGGSLDDIFDSALDFEPRRRESSQPPHSSQAAAQPSTHSAGAEDLEDLFDSILNLEDQFYQEGYALGAADGEKAGRVEGRFFGMKTGYEKMLEMGRLHGRAEVWESRIMRGMSENGNARDAKPAEENIAGTIEGVEVASENAEEHGSSSRGNFLNLDFGDEELNQLVATVGNELKAAMRPLPPNPRLERHIRTLLELTDPKTINMANTEENIEEFEDRFRRATAKVKVIESIIGEKIPSIGNRETEAKNGGNGKVEKSGLRVVREDGTTVEAQERNIEDFGLGRRG